MEYWEECIKEAFEDAKIEATTEQIDNVIGWVEGAFENYSLSNGYDCIPDPKESEISELRRLLEREKSKTICPECKGSRITVTYGGTLKGTSQCFKCRGEGFIY